MYNEIMAGSDVRDDLYQMVMEVLPACFGRLNTSADRLEHVLRKTRSVAHQVKAQVPMEEIQIGSDPTVQMDKQTDEENDEIKSSDPDLDCLRNLLKNSLQCAAWYGLRAHTLGADLREYRDGFVVGLHALGDGTLGLGGLTSRVLEAGQLVSACAAMHTETARNNLGGRSVQSAEIVRPVPNSLIVYGSDLSVLKALLETAQTKGLKVYAAGGMVSAFGYEDLAAMSSLAGYVLLLDRDADFSASTLILTDFLPDNLEKLTFTNIFVSGLAGWDGAGSVDNGSDEESANVLWSSLNQDDSSSEHLVRKLLETGWDYSALMEKMGSILSGLQAGSITSVDLLVLPPEMQRDWDSTAYDPGRSGSLYLTAGGPLMQEPSRSRDAQLPNSVHMGEAVDILEGVRLFQSLASHMHSPVHSLPAQVHFPYYREEFIGLLFGLMSFGLRGFQLSEEWRAVISDRVLQLLEDRWHVQIGKQYTKGGNEDG